MKSQEELRELLADIDNQGYGAYKKLKGVYEVGHYTLFLDYIQGDPFASPSKARVRIPKFKTDLPEELYSTPVRRLALEDYMARRAKDVLFDVTKGHRGSGKSGKIYIDSGGQEVLERTACKISDDWIELRIEIGLPAAGRRILGKKQAAQMLCNEVPEIATETLLWPNLPQEEVYNFVYCVENQEFIRSKLDDFGLISFVADGSILPRDSGASDHPLNTEDAVRFEAPDSMRVTFELPNPVQSEEGPIHEITGMGIPMGITLIIGGGYHGKSTLLQAIQRGVYPHIPGDGREYVVSNPDLVKVRAEDGRRIEKVDIHAFISDLPTEEDTELFSSDDGSGSTSQAANIMEAVELGASGLLVDEDTSATNFMIRDARMQAMVQKENEPITPFLDRVDELYEDHGISTILVMGGSGDYFDVAHNVIMMRDFLPYDVTEKAQEIANSYRNNRDVEEHEPFNLPAPRIPESESFEKARKSRRRMKIKPRGLHKLQFGREDIELRFVEQLIDPSQTNAIGESLRYIVEELLDGEHSLGEVLVELQYRLDEEGLSILCPFGPDQHPGNLARPRRFEIAAAINRLRVVQMHQSKLVEEEA